MTGMAWENGSPEQVAERLRAMDIGEVRAGLDMAAWTPVRIGGVADVFVEVDSVRSLERVVRYLASSRVRTLVVGGGHHLLVHDGGIEGVVISTSRLTGARWVDQDRLELEAGVPLAMLDTMAVEANLAAPSFLGGVEGSLGWALAGRTGVAADHWLPYLEELRLLTPSGRRMVLAREKWQQAGALPPLRGKVLVSAVLRLGSARRRTRATSVVDGLEGAAIGPLFHPVPQRRHRLIASASELIARSGLAGVRINGARISPEAPDWIENTGHATARDVLTLIKLMRERVKRDHGVVLQPTVDVVGRPAARRTGVPWLAGQTDRDRANVGSAA